MCCGRPAKKLARSLLVEIATVPQRFNRRHMAAFY